MATNTAKKIAVDFFEFIYKETTSQQEFVGEREESMERILSEITNGRIPPFHKKYLNEIKVGDDLSGKTLYFDTTYNASYTPGAVYFNPAFGMGDPQHPLYPRFNVGIIGGTSGLSINYIESYNGAYVLIRNQGGSWEADSFTFPPNSVVYSIMQSSTPPSDWIDFTKMWFLEPGY
jgi:hypothetical protein